MIMSVPKSAFQKNFLSHKFEEMDYYYFHMSRLVGTTSKIQIFFLLSY